MTRRKQSLLYLFLIIRFLQDKFGGKGFCFRKATTIDKMYWSNKGANILFGKGIADAHYLESKIVIYPGIIISNDLFSFIENENINRHPFTKKWNKAKRGNLKR